jgi:hypothetical protein
MKKSTAIIIISALLCVITALGAATYTASRRARELETSLSLREGHAQYEFTESVYELSNALQKAAYARGAAIEADLCAEIFAQATAAELALSALPEDEHELETAEDFINRVRDYALAMTHEAASGGLNEEQHAALASLASTAQILSMNAPEAFSAGTEAGSGEYSLTNSEFPELPSLIYDGPFSEHLTGASAKMLEGKENLDEDAARKKAAAFLGVDEGRVIYSGVCAGEMPAWYFTARLENSEVNISVSRQGGEVIGFLSTREAQDGTMTGEEAVEVAKQFLHRRGIENMRETYYIREGNVITVNLAYEQDGVLCYSDLIKVGVAADTGAVCSYEARGYLTNHCARELPEVTAQREQAEELIAPELDVLGVQLALIPSAGQYEKLCWEFKCRAEEESEYIIYVSAETGEEEKILILLEDENGALTV